MVCACGVSDSSQTNRVGWPYRNKGSVPFLKIFLIDHTSLHAYSSFAFDYTICWNVLIRRVGEIFPIFPVVLKGFDKFYPQSQLICWCVYNHTVNSGSDTKGSIEFKRVLMIFIIALFVSFPCCFSFVLCCLYQN